MRQGVGLSFRFAALLCLAACAATIAVAQDYDALTAEKRMFPGIGPGLRAVRRGANGNYYVLAAPAPGLTVYDPQGKTLLQIGPPPAGQNPAEAPPNTIVYGEDADVDAEGRIFVADRGVNAVKIFSPRGDLLRSIAVAAPVSLAAISGGELAVSTLRSPHLVTVFDGSGKVVREFGDPADITERSELNRFLNIGRLASDPQGRVYYGFAYLPEPTVRQFDRNGYGGIEVQLTGLDFIAQAQAVRREIDRQEKRGDSPSFKRVMTAVGVDPASGEVWMAIGNTLLRFDREGNRRATYKLYTPEGARLDTTTILIESNRMLIGGDPLGVYEFERPDKRRRIDPISSTAPSRKQAPPLKRTQHAVSHEKWP